VTVWDVETSTAVAEFEEHDKRAWTVDYCRTDPRLLASGSDDGQGLTLVHFSARRKRFLWDTSRWCA